jgi:hypothetical protein
VKPCAQAVCPCETLLHLLIHYRHATAKRLTGLAATCLPSERNFSDNISSLYEHKLQLSLLQNLYFQTDYIRINISYASTSIYENSLSVSFAPGVGMSYRSDIPKDEGDAQEEVSCSGCYSPYKETWWQKNMDYCASPTDLCERCHFPKQVVDDCVENGIFIRSGTRQSIDWEEDIEEGKRWMKITWIVWEGNAGYNGSIFSLSVAPGQYSCLVIFNMSMMKTNALETFI